MFYLNSAITFTVNTMENSTFSSSWYVETVLTIYCPMNFSAFPLDVQICHFEVGSVGMESKDVIYNGTTSYSSENQRPTAFEVNTNKQ